MGHPVPSTYLDWPRQAVGQVGPAPASPPPAPDAHAAAEAKSEMKLPPEPPPPEVNEDGRKALWGWEDGFLGGSVKSVHYLDGLPLKV